MVLKDLTAWGLIPTDGHGRSDEQTSHSLTASAYATVMGTRWIKIVLEWRKLPAYFYDMCAVQFCNFVLFHQVHIAAG